MADVPSAANLLQELDARQDEVLAKLNDLNSALENILKQYVDSQRAAREEAAGAALTPEPASAEPASLPRAA